MTRLKNTTLSVFMSASMSVHKNHFRKQKYGTESVSKTFKISKVWWNILLWHDQTQKHEFGCFHTISAHNKYFKKKHMRQSLLKSFSKFLIYYKVFCCEKTKRATNNRMFLEKIFIQKLLQKRKVWDKITLENFLVASFQWNISMRHKQMYEHKLSYISLKLILNIILRLENVGQIYLKHKIRETLNCDMNKALEQYF